MQCLAGAILVILLMQNSLGQNEEDPGCGEKPRALNNYMRRLNNAENEEERPEDLKDLEDPNDPKSRTGMFRYKSQSYYPRQGRSRQIHIGGPPAMSMGGPPAMSMGGPRGMSMGGSSAISMGGPHSISMGGPSAISMGSPSGTWIIPGGHSQPSMSSSFFQYGMSGSSQMNSGSIIIKYKLHLPMDELMHRFMKLCFEWPSIKISLEMKHLGSFRDLLRAAFECMYPEWDNIKINMIFSGINDEIVLRNLFVAMFPNWPQREIDVIFSPGNTIPLIIRKLLLYLVPDMSQKDNDFIFSKPNSVRLIIRRIFEVLFPSMKQSNGFDIFSIGNSVLHIFDRLVQGFFPQMPAPPLQMQTVYTVLFPGMAYNITSSEPDLPFLLSKYKDFQSMPIEPSKQENIMMLILLEWLKQNPHIQYKLPRPGKDDFDNFKTTFFQNTPPNTIVPREFLDDNFLRKLFELWKRFVVERYPNDKQIDLQTILDFISKFIQARITIPNANVPSPEPTFTPTQPAPTLNEIPNTITIPFIENLRDLLPPDILKYLLELFPLPDKTKSGPLILNILSDWQKNNLENRVPLSKLMELILRIITSNWPDADVERVVGRNLNLEQILINLAKVMLLERPNMSLEGKINSPQFILEMLLKKALPHIPKQKIEAVFDGSNDMERVLRSILKMLYPNWPSYDPSSMHFDPQVLEKILSEIIDWPRIKSSIIAGGVISMPLIVESFIHAIFPSWPQFIVSMITSGRTPLPLIVQKIIQIIATNNEDREVVLHYDEQSPMVQISEAMFRKIFPDWPNYSAVLNIPIKGERNSVLGQLLILVQDSTAKYENSLKCLNDRDSNWAFALFIALLKYVQQESVLNSMKMF